MTQNKKHIFLNALLWRANNRHLPTIISNPLLDGDNKKRVVITPLSLYYKLNLLLNYYATFTCRRTSTLPRTALEYGHTACAFSISLCASSALKPATLIVISKSKPKAPSGF